MENVVRILVCRGCGLTIYVLSRNGVCGCAKIFDRLSLLSLSVSVFVSCFSVSLTTMALVLHDRSENEILRKTFFTMHIIRGQGPCLARAWGHFIKAKSTRVPSLDWKQLRNTGTHRVHQKSQFEKISQNVSFCDYLAQSRDHAVSCSTRFQAKSRLIFFSISKMSTASHSKFQIWSGFGG